MSPQERSPFLTQGLPADPQDARRTNRTLVLRSIITRGPASRAEIARRTGLSRPTVSVIAAELITTGLLMEGERISSGGAPGTLLEMAKSTGVTIAVDLRRRDAIRIAAVAANGEIVSQAETSAATTDEVIDLIREFSAEVDRTATIGVALGVPGWVNAAGDWVRRADNDLDPAMQGQLRRMMRMPVFALNSTDALAIADLRDSPPNLTAQATVAMAEEVSAGLIIDGRLRSGRNRPVGEIGHLVPCLGQPGSSCSVCGQPCLGAYVLPLRADQSEAMQRSAAGALAAVMAPITSAVEIAEIVLSGFPTAASDSMADFTATAMNDRMPAEQVPAVRVSAQGEDAVVLGAAALMLYQRLG
ncbi:MAG: ROK family protein [Candidatus Nanopelagicales bacterium]